MAGVAKHLKGFPRRYAQLKMPWFSQMQILDQPVLELNPLNFHLSFDFPPAERVFSTRSSKKKSRIFRYKIFVFEVDSCIKNK
jgi:hypothetical protein